MPIRVTTRPDAAGLWLIGTVRPAGTQAGVRVRRRAGSDHLATAKQEAVALEASILRDHHLGRRAAVHSFAAVALSYLEHAPRSDGTKALVRRLLLHFRETPIDRIDQAAVDKARKILLRPDASPGTVLRNLIAPLRAILTHGDRRGWGRCPQFDVPRQAKGRTRFLMPAEVMRLQAAAPPQLQPLITFLIGTGCRLGEALALQWDAVDLQGARVILYEGETKSGARRVVALPPAVGAALAALPHRVGAVFRRRRNKRLRGAMVPIGYRAGGGYGGQVKRAWASTVAAAGVEGATPHTLRHSWASWHYAVHQDLMLLKHEGGWSSVALVERYAHLMPAGQVDAIRAVWGLNDAVAAGWSA